MVPIEILNEFDNFALERINNGINLRYSLVKNKIGYKEYDACLFLCRNELDHLLQSSSPVLVQSNFHELRSSSIDKNCALLIVGKFKQLLAKIISEGICHVFSK